MNHAALQSTALSAVLLAVVAPLATGQLPHPEIPLFSLADGNQWTYMCEAADGSATFQNVRVAGRVHAGDLHPSRIVNYLFPVSGQDVLFYNDSCAKTCEANPRFLAGQGRPSVALPLCGPWYPCQYGCAPGGVIELPRIERDCLHGMRGRVTQVGAPITVPAGTFPWSITITYDEHPCCDDQVLTETLVPGIGLVHRTVARYPGVQEWSLCFALVNGKVVGALEACRSERMPRPEAATLDAATWGTVKATFRD